jgi:hypothetical protein
VTAATARPGSSAGSARPGWADFVSSWERSAEEVRGDQLATAAVGVGGALVGAAFALFGRGTAAAVWVGMVSLCVTPGCAFVCWHLTRDRFVRVIAVLAASVTWTILISSALVWLQVTNLEVIMAATVGVGGFGSAAFLVVRLTRHFGGPQNSTPVEEWENPRLWPSDSIDRGQAFAPSLQRRSNDRFPPDRERAVARDVAVYPVQGSAPGSGLRSLPATRKHSMRQAILVCALMAAVTLYAISVIRAHDGTVSSWGLLPLLGAPFLIAITLSAAVLLISLRYIRSSWPTALVALCLLLVEFNGTQVLLDTIPLSSWTYKHFGVTDYMVHGGALKDQLDIYQQWPGFFAAAADLVHLSGLSSLATGNWPHLFFEAIDSVVVFAIARRMVPWHRAVPYITTLLFFTANWEGQFYFSPQSTAFLLAILFQFFLLPSLEVERLRRPFRKWRSLHIPPLETQGEGRSTAVSKAAQGAGLIALFTAIVITHQMSPYIVLAGVLSLWVLGVLRQPFLILILTAIALCYILLHAAAVDQNFVLNGFSFSNATGKPVPLNPSAQQEIAGLGSEAVGLGLWGATGICVLSYWRRLGVIAIPAIFAFVPFALVMVSDYQGEGIYRVFLFSSPWCGLIIARRLVELRRSPSLRLAVVGCWAMFAALASAQGQDFGMYPMLQVPQSEVSASEYFLDHAPQNAVLILAAANFPSRINGNYVLHNAKQSQNDLSLDEVPNYEGKGLLRVSPAALAGSVANLAGGAGYLVIAPSMESYDKYYQFIYPGVLPALETRLKTSPYWKVWYENDGTLIFRALPQGQSGKKIKHPSGSAK